MGTGTVLVTGGSRGLGRSIVETLAADGFAVAFTYRENESAAQELVDLLDAPVRAYRLDLADTQRPGELVDEVERDLGPIEGLVNNAGVRREALLAMTPDADWHAVLDTNLGGAFRCCRAVVGGMVHRRKGSIVNVSSLSALHGLAGQAAYSASKAGLIGMTRSLAREVGRRGIRANAVVPGFIATDMTSDIPEAKIRALRAAECLPLGVTAESVAGSVAFLLSERAASITGQTIVIDAGTTA